MFSMVFVLWIWIWLKMLANLILFIALFSYSQCSRYDTELSFKYPFRFPGFFKKDLNRTEWLLVNYQYKHFFFFVRSMNNKEHYELVMHDLKNMVLSAFLHILTPKLYIKLTMIRHAMQESQKHKATLIWSLDLRIRRPYLNRNRNKKNNFFLQIIIYFF